MTDAGPAPMAVAGQIGGMRAGALPNRLGARQAGADSTEVVRHQRPRHFVDPDPAPDQL